MPKRSKKGFRKLENHELSEFTTLKGDVEDSGSDSEIIDIEREDSMSRRGGGLCCCCLALYVIILSCVVVLLAMTGVYFGYNMMNISSDYHQRISRLESRVDQLEKNLNTAGSTSESKMSNMTHRVSVVNDSVSRVAGDLKTHSGTVQEEMETVKDSLKDLLERVTAFESHPPTIGENEVSNMRNNMAEFHSHLESYDSQLDEVKKLAGDATFLVTKIDERVQVFERNLTGLKGGLEGLRQQHKEADDNLDLLTFQVSALRIAVQVINESLLQEVNMTKGSINETVEVLEGLARRVSELGAELTSMQTTVQSLNSSLDGLFSTVDHMHQSIHDIEAGTESAPTTESTELPTTQPPTEDTEPPPTTATEPTTTSETAATTTSTEPSAVTPTSESSAATTSESSATSEPFATTAATEPSATTAATEPSATTTSEPATTTAATTTSEHPPTDTNATTTSTQTSEPKTEPLTAGVATGTSTTQEGTTQEGTTQEGTPLTESTTTAEPNASKSPDEDGDQDSNEEGLTQSTPPASSSTPTGVESESDSTLGTEDIPSSQGHNSSSSTSSGQGSPSDSIPEEQPPTVKEDDKGLEKTIRKLNELLVQFPTLDSDGDGVLELYEFSQYSEDTVTAQRIFYAMDLNSDSAVTYEEISETISMLEQQVTEGTEDAPANNDDEFTGSHTEEQPLGTHTEPVVTADEPPVPTGHQDEEEEEKDTDNGTLQPPQTTTAEPTIEVDTATPPASSEPADEGGMGGYDSELMGTENETNNGLVDSSLDNKGEDSSVDQTKGALTLLKGIQNAFMDLDENADYHLSESEFLSYFNSDDPRLVNIFTFLDSNSDYFVTLSEISTAISAQQEGNSHDEDTVTSSPEEELADYIHGENV